MIRIAWLLLLPLMSNAANYSAERLTVDSIEVIRLTDTARDTVVSIVPSIGNNAFEMKVKGQNILWYPHRSLADFKAKPGMVGNPFLAPWANRIDQEAYFANGRRFLLNPDLKNYRRDGHGQPIHGLVVSAPWEVVSVKADAGGAETTSRLELWRNPGWMAQFPFAHTIRMTHRLREGTLEVATEIENHSSESMPLSLGYHTYYKVPDAPRDEWRVHLPVRDHVVLSERLVPTGEIKPAQLPDPVTLAGRQLDDVFSGLIRDDRGGAEFRVEGRKQKISVVYGPKYLVSVVYAPPGRDFICFEPMTGVTNAFNLSHAGLYKDLQSIPPGGTWRESFWIKPGGF